MTMDVHTIAAFAGLGFASVSLFLACPVPLALAHAAWPMRHPLVALLAWQALGLGSALVMIAAVACVGLALSGNNAWLGLVPACALTLYLVVRFAKTAVDAARLRARHLALVSMLTAPHATWARTRVMNDRTPVAYCVPCGARSVTVLSQGLLDRLGPEELAAVIAHEKAHLEQRHDLLLLAFRAWRSALPWLPIAARAEAEVAALVEMLADDRARREVPDEAIVRAMLAVGTDGAAGPARSGKASARVTDRLRRLAA